MTERHEITSMIDDVRIVLDEVNYEAATRPGEGEEFERVLLDAAKNLEASIVDLKKAEDMLQDSSA